MCGRFALTHKPRDVDEHFAVADVEDFPARYNIAPTDPILLVTAGFSRPQGSNLPARRSMLVRWGLTPGWSKNPKELYINARSETILNSACSKPRRLTARDSSIRSFRNCRRANSRCCA